MKKIQLLLICCGLLGAAKAQSKLEQMITWSPALGYYEYTYQDQDLYEENQEVFMGVKLDYGIGYRITNKITLGASVGIRHFMLPDYVEIYGNEIWTDQEDRLESFFKLPVAANFKVRFIDKKVSPYLGLSGGYMFALSDDDKNPLAQNSVFGNAHAGVSINFKNNKSLYAGPIVEMMSCKNTDRLVNTNNGWSAKSSYEVWQFGIQVSFAF